MFAEGYKYAPQANILRCQSVTKLAPQAKIMRFQSAANGFLPCKHAKMFRFQSATNEILPCKMSAAGESFSVSERY